MSCNYLALNVLNGLVKWCSFQYLLQSALSLDVFAHADAVDATQLHLNEFFLVSGGRVRERSLNLL